MLAELELQLGLVSLQLALRVEVQHRLVGHP